MIVILTGKCASGKNAIYRKLVATGLNPIVPVTSRPQKQGEIDGSDYHFKTPEEFQRLIMFGKLMEYRAYNTCVEGKNSVWYYGMLKNCVTDIKKDYVVVSDPKGVVELQKQYGKQNCIIFYVSTPDQVRIRRAKQEKGFDQTEWNRRMLDDEIWFQNAYHDFEINNADENKLDDIVSFIKKTLKICKFKKAAI